MKVGDLIDGRYLLVRLMGIGGVGVTFEAQDQAGGERLALKCLLSTSSSHDDSATRFIHEALSASNIKSQYLVKVLDGSISSDGTPYIVMEHLEGENLEVLLMREGRLNHLRAVTLMLQVCEALELAHQRGIVHRALKPETLFVVRWNDGYEWVKVLDFGAAELQAPLTDESSMSTRYMVGTPCYMAPEQLESPQCSDPRIDVYSTGVILYELLSGRRPYKSKTCDELLDEYAHETHTPLRSVEPMVDPELEQIVECAISHAPDARFDSMADFADALQAYVDVLLMDMDEGDTVVDTRADFIGSGSGAVHHGPGSPRATTASRRIGIVQPPTTDEIPTGVAKPPPMTDEIPTNVVKPPPTTDDIPTDVAKPPPTRDEIPKGITKPFPIMRELPPDTRKPSTPEGGHTAETPRPPTGTADAPRSDAAQGLATSDEAPTKVAQPTSALSMPPTVFTQRPATPDEAPTSAPQPQATTDEPPTDAAQPQAEADEPPTDVEQPRSALPLPPTRAGVPPASAGLSPGHDPMEDEVTFRASKPAPQTGPGLKFIAIGTGIAVLFSLMAIGGFVALHFLGDGSKDTTSAQLGHESPSLAETPPQPTTSELTEPTVQTEQPTQPEEPAQLEQPTATADQAAENSETTTSTGVEPSRSTGPSANDPVDRVTPQPEPESISPSSEPAPEPQPSDETSPHDQHSVEELDDEEDDTLSDPQADPANGFLSVTTQPPTKVYVDGRFLQKTPLTRHEVPAGRHLVTMISDDTSIRETEPVEIAAQESKSIVRDFRPPTKTEATTGTLTVDSQPPTKVYVNGRFIQNTPLRNHELPVGQHRLSLINLDANIRHASSFTIKAGESTNISRTFESQEPSPDVVPEEVPPE